MIRMPIAVNTASNTSVNLVSRFGSRTSGCRPGFSRFVSRLRVLPGRPLVGGWARPISAAPAEDPNRPAMLLNLGVGLLGAARAARRVCGLRRGSGHRRKQRPERGVGALPSWISHK